ncbi:conserved unknown protein [Ectocarpus siliculosus]|uniref:NYN domain-containing protein n=1 Tax=Ectocarpus siliculosus TaxID=2880 RepID=D8LAX9_ECTSI|nr:conserved unknown protein [Ectocarpus siliculosus]|eukprot:CBN76488.1 conserved unknown protein [Ectocarpus siliculosus]
MMAANEQGVQGNAAGERKQRVGVFVDVENVLGWLKRGGCTELLAKAGELGVVGIRRAFGDFSNATVASRQDELQRHGFDLVHTVHPAKGKSNSADISMTIDVMESCRTPGGVFDASGGAPEIGGGGAAAVYGGQAHSAQNARFDSRNGSGNGGVRGHGWRAGASTPPPPPPSLPPAFGGLGALSVIRPSEKLYMHLLSVEYSPSAAADRTGDTAGSLASDWGSGLSEVTLAKGLVSLAEACGGQGGGDNSRAAAAAAAAAALGGGGGGGGGGAGVALDREEAFRVANLLQRCGFLSWVAKEQQWLVTVPADVEVLRRRRDETMMEELLTRCQEAGVPFEPTLAANLLWSKARR